MSVEKKKILSKMVSCTLSEEEVKMLNTIKDRGLNTKLIIQPSKVVRLGILIMSQLDISTICAEEISINEEIRKQDYLHQKSLKKMQSKFYHKGFSFILDKKSFVSLKMIIDQALPYKVVLTISSVIRKSIKYVFQLNCPALKEQYQSLENKLDVKNF